MNHIYSQPQFGENWFTYPNFYKSCVERFGDNSIFVEVGSWKGKSSAFLAVEIINSNKDIKLYCVDTWKGSPEHKNDNFIINDTLYDLFLDNIKDLTSVITPVRNNSVDASKIFDNESLDMVFIDACHEYEYVKQDIQIWYPKVKKGGIIAGHDYHLPWNGVVRAVDEFFINKKIEKSEACWIHIKE